MLSHLKLSLVFIFGFAVLVELRRFPKRFGSDAKFFSGDIRFTPSQKQAIDNGRGIHFRSQYSYASVNDSFALWPNAIIPYEIDCSLEFMPTALQAIQDAMEAWEAKTCIRFVKRTNENDYVEFFRESGCWSFLGRVGGKNQISVGEDCDSEDVLTHEIGHAIGFYHEHNRADRDLYVNVLWQNIADAIMRQRNHTAGRRSLGYILTGKPRVCRDSNPICSHYTHFCNQSSNVRRTCELSCQSSTCTMKNACVDFYKICPQWKSQGKCSERSTFTRCPQSCNPVCQTSAVTPKPTTTMQTSTTKPIINSLPKTSSGSIRLGHGNLCIDQYPECPYYASLGECVTFAEFLPRVCMKSCNVTTCDKTIPKPPGKCNEPLGLAYDGNSSKLPDSNFKASSYLTTDDNRTAEARNARLYMVDRINDQHVPAWCAENETTLPNEWIQVDLGKQRNIHYIATQGRDKSFERVGKFKISYSNDGVNFISYKINGKEKIFNGNCDHFTPILNQFTSPISAQHVRLYPIEANYPCIRMEFYGC